MNDVFFTCHTCRTYIDAGYRWAYWNLEHSGIVQKGTPISISSVLSAHEYWDGEELKEEYSTWLNQLLPLVKDFLIRHEAHQLFYEEAQNFLWSQDEFDWMDENQLERADLSPRLFAERMGFVN